MVCAYAVAFPGPGWLRRDGLPRSWRHFTYGLDHLTREQARATLRTAGAVGLPYMKKDDGDAWIERHRMIAGW